MQEGGGLTAPFVSHILLSVLPEGDEVFSYVTNIPRHLKKWKKSCSELGMLKFTQNLAQGGEFHCTES